MPISPYGVLAARATDRRREGGTQTPHYQLFLKDNAGASYQVPVNVLSKVAPSELLFLADDDFRHPVTRLLPPAGSGWTPLASQAGSGALDFIRGNLFDPTRMRPLPPDRPGVDNDLSDFLDHYAERAIADPAVAVYAFGQGFGPHHSLLARVFRFRAARSGPAVIGVHDIHMNQGNVDPFVPDDGVWQDGGLLFHMTAEDRWVGVFLAFQSQAWHTDDTTGHTIPVPAARPFPAGEHEAPVRIVAARVASAGPGRGAESVTLLNASPDPVDMGGWRLADASGHRRPLPARSLASGTTVTVAGGNGFRLGPEGGAVTLIDPAGLKVHGVAYTRDQVRGAGWTTTF
ncbi:DUF2278 family protein [Streptomyces luteoverticillatus]|uniref:DUF2278 family protein n=1 Tax=Streptomyces luteoverticillatus TaxID=66425 RepID=A0A3S9PJC4_STRLT|nr:DUF2278 family protein [Streptomyces luteoverticillatus]AZQ72445.1 DUF2278 family protein [Streptomyces luteoverticillatus]